jgi:hypothetical protein
MPTLYPANWTEPTPAAKPVKPTKPGMDLIRALTDRDPKDYGEIIDTVKKAEETAGRYWRRADILGWIQEIDAERRPKVEPKDEGEVKP